jgi:hypothetical protein
MHVTWSNNGAKNIRDTIMYSLGHAESAMESTALIDIPGVLMNKSGEKGLRVVLKDCCFSANHNFNLLSMSRLMHKQGRKIVCGDKSLTCIEKGREKSLISTLWCA